MSFHSLTHVQCSQHVRRLQQLLARYHIRANSYITRGSVRQTITQRVHACRRSLRVAGRLSLFRKFHMAYVVILYVNISLTALPLIIGIIGSSSGRPWRTTIGLFSARQHAERAICYRKSVCLSVCLSHGWISQKRLNVSSKFFHYLIGPTF